MRDPDLVHRAQLAATALEGAWHRWRVAHGMAAGPMPAISSYVGYSLEEPWGQPRIVFGLAAEDAEHLATLLDRHECVGPVYAAVSNLSSAPNLPSRSNGRFVPLPVPRQAPGEPGQPRWPRSDSHQPDESSDQEQTLAREARSSLDGLVPGPGGGAAVEYDEPLFRQAAADMADAAAIQEIVGRHAASGDLHSPDLIAEVSTAETRTTEISTTEISTAETRTTEISTTEASTAEASTTEASRAADGLPEDRFPDGFSGDGTRSMGALARAASAARAEAEARIRAARTGPRAGAAAGFPPSTQDMVLPPIQATDILDPLPRPEVASGAYVPSASSDDEPPGSVRDEPDDNDGDFNPEGEIQVPETGPGTGTGQVPAGQPGVAPKRGRAPRGYQIPRLPRTKRTGAVPDTSGAGGQTT